jgi:hypothetical protein
MAKATFQGSADKLALYEALVASVDGVERKGAANPYTSRNGHMTSFLDKEGEVSIRLDQNDRETYVERYDTELAVQYGSVMKEFVVVPDDLLERPDELREWFVRSWEWVGTLKAKPTKK